VYLILVWHREYILKGIKARFKRTNTGLLWEIFETLPIIRPAYYTKKKQLLGLNHVMDLLLKLNIANKVLLKVSAK